jgi:hypothetical protein
MEENLQYIWCTVAHQSTVVTRYCGSTSHRYQLYGRHDDGGDNVVEAVIGKYELVSSHRVNPVLISALKPGTGGR